MSVLIADLKGALNEVLDGQHAQERKHILNWLTPIDYAPEQAYYISMRAPNTGQWLLESEEYRTWLKDDMQTIFCPGKPGAGKTLMAAIVVDDLYERYKIDSSIGIAYLYCDFKRRHEQRTDDLMAALLKQLAQQHRDIPDTVRAFYDKYKHQSKRPMLDEILELLISVCALYSKVFIILDALDECQERDGCRRRFLSEIIRLQTKAGANILATSRSIPEIEAAFKESMPFRISARVEDVQTYLTARMHQLPSFVLDKPELQNNIKAHISERVDGMCV
jgi:hypothetical protein